MFNAVTMIIACPACNTRYAVPDTAIGVEGRTVRCAKCRHSWFQDGASPASPEPAVMPPVAPAPAPEPEPVPESAPATAPDPLPQPAAIANAAFEDDAAPAPPPPVYQESPAPLSPQGAGAETSYEHHSQFDYEPPFRPRRNLARVWMIAAALFAVVALGAVAAAAWYGLPGWLPFAQPMFAQEQPGLKLDFPEKQQGMRELADGSWFFEANGSVTNIAQTAQSVPAILVVLRDARGRVVYNAEINPPKRVLAPGESLSVTEALVPVPKAAVKADYGWKPGT